MVFSNLNCRNCEIALNIPHQVLTMRSNRETGAVMDNLLRLLELDVDIAVARLNEYYFHSDVSVNKDPLPTFF